MRINEDTHAAPTMFGFTERATPLMPGIKYQGPIPVEDVRKTLFGWQAVTGPVETTVLLPDGVRRVTDETRKVVVRSDTGKVLGVHKVSYSVHQFDEWLLDNVAAILDDEVSIAAAGLLSDGAKAWVAVEVPETRTTPEGVEYRPRLLGCTSHDGSIASTYKRIIHLMICSNQLSAALNEKGQMLRVKHTSRSSLRIHDAREALAMLDTISSDFEQWSRSLCETPVTEAQWKAFLDVIAPAPADGATKRATTLAEDRRDAFETLWASDARVVQWKGTAFGVLQAANTYNTWMRPVRGIERAERNMTNAVDGTLDKQDGDVLETLRKVLATV